MKVDKDDKIVVVLGDTHCGHVAGLTPPLFNNNAGGTRMKKLREKIWCAIKAEILTLGKIDVLLHTGDAIDGKGTFQGEHVTTDLIEQCNMAEECIRMVGAKKTVMVYGTPFHVGKEVDFEAVIARNVGAKIGSHEWVKINGTVFDLKHEPSGASQVPHGRHTGVARDRLWNVMWHDEDQQQPKAHVFLRGHVHYFNYCGGPNWLAMTCPPTQFAATKYGSRRCSGYVDLGFISFVCHRDGRRSWNHHRIALKDMQAKVYEL